GIQDSAKATLIESILQNDHLKTPDSVRSLRQKVKKCRKNKDRNSDSDVLAVIAKTLKSTNASYDQRLAVGPVETAEANQLPGEAPWDVLVHTDVTHDSFRSFQMQVLQGRFSGTFFIDIPSKFGVQFWRVLETAQADIWAGFLQLILLQGKYNRVSNSDFSRLCTIISTAELVCRKGGQSVFILDSIPRDVYITSADRIDSKFQFKVMDVNQIDEDTLGVLTGPSKYDLHRTPSIVPRHRGIGNDLELMRLRPVWESEWWRVQEFVTNRAVSEFDRLCRYAFGATGPEHRGSRLALAATRIARRMARWTLEGTPFSCTIYLANPNLIADTTRHKTAITFGEQVRDQADT
ncbi:MAG: hypothetical protein MI741_20335, partial [Rhodospirillales bacterium]|nr:hypothetical protein [Rhodospirillales bacterium]